MVITLENFRNKELAVTSAQINSLINEIPDNYTLILTGKDLKDDYISKKIIEGSHMYKHEALTTRLIMKASVVVFVSNANTCQVLKQNFLY